MLPARSFLAKLFSKFRSKSAASQIQLQADQPPILSLSTFTQPPAIWLLATIFALLITTIFLIIPGRRQKEPTSTPASQATKSAEIKVASGSFLGFDQKTQTVEIFNPVATAAAVLKVAITPQTQIMGITSKNLSTILPGSQIFINYSSLKPNSTTAIADKILIIPLTPAKPNIPQPGATND